MVTTYRTSSGYISHSSGTEGPSYDPYGWDEWEVSRNGRTACLRLGLGCWLELDGRSKVHEWEAANGLDELMDAFAAHVGLTFQDVMEFAGMCEQRRYENDPYYGMDSIRGYI